MAAASAAAFPQPQQPLPPQPIDATALQIWCSRVDGRLDDQATAITGVGLQLEMTIGHAKDAMNAIIEGVRGELVGFNQAPGAPRPRAVEHRGRRDPAEVR